MDRSKNYKEVQAAESELIHDLLRLGLSTRNFDAATIVAESRSVFDAAGTVSRGMLKRCGWRAGSAVSSPTKQLFPIRTARELASGLFCNVRLEVF